MYEKLPLYDCHKQVRSGLITAINKGPSGAALDVKNLLTGGHQLITVDSDYLARCPKLAVGGYFVVYQEGDEYTSYSPAGPFEGGYTLADEERWDIPGERITIESVAQRRRLTALNFAVDLNARQPKLADPDQVIADAKKYLAWLEKKH